MGPRLPAPLASAASRFVGDAVRAPAPTRSYAPRSWGVPVDFGRTDGELRSLVADPTLDIHFREHIRQTVVRRQMALSRMQLGTVTDTDEEMESHGDAHGRLHEERRAANQQIAEATTIPEETAETTETSTN